MCYAGDSCRDDQRYKHWKGNLMPVYPAGTRAKASISYLDAGGERGAFSMFAPVITDVNYDAQVAAFATLLSAADAITLGNRINDRYADETYYAVARPTNGAAREIALKIIFRSAATGQTWLSYLPTIDISLITYDPNYGARDVVLLSGTEVAALVAGLNGITPKNPYDPTYADNGTVVGAQVVRGFK
jgi:hypothetical protein